MENELPRNEYPRPQFIRSEWMSLNGEWQFEIDQGDSGLSARPGKPRFNRKDHRPLLPGIRTFGGWQHRIILNAVWYRRTVTIPERWAGKVILLHFQAVDYDTSVWVNGVEVGRHRGGFSPFTCSTQRRGGGRNEIATIVVRARDRSSAPAAARQTIAALRDHIAAMYTRTTGIWQTVWMEPVPEPALQTPAHYAGCRRQPVHSSTGAFRKPARAHAQDGALQPAGRVCAVEIAADRDLAPQGY